MRTNQLFGGILVLLCCQLSYAQVETPKTTPASTTAKPVEPKEEVVLATEPSEDSEKKPKDNAELLMEILEKSKRERVGYFQTSQDLSKPYSVHKKVFDTVLVLSLKSEIDTIKNKIKQNRKIYDDKKATLKNSADSLKLINLRTDIIKDSMELITKRKKLIEADNPNVIFDTVRIFLQDARINRLIFTVKDDNGFYGNKVPISVTNYKSRTLDKLCYQGSNPKLQNTYLILGEVMNYISVTERLSYPPDTNVYLTAKNDVAQLFNNGKQLEYFDVRLYTDGKGLSGESNGLVQTEINTSFYGITQNIRNRNLTWLPFVRLNLGISKFDSKFDTLQLNSLTTRSGVDYLKISQYSNINLRIETDVIRYSRIHDCYLTIGHQMQSTVVSDTSGNSQRIFSPSFYTVLGGTMFNYPRMKCEFKLPFHLAYLMDQPFVDYDKKLDFMIIPEIEIVFDPVKSAGQTEVAGTRIFGRVRYFDMTSYRGGNFWQLQLGAQVSLSEILKKN